MKRSPAFLVVAVALVLCGCVVVSTFPFYEDADLVPSKPLEGRWVGADAKEGSKDGFTFRKWDAQGCWFESVEDGKTNVAGEAHLFKLGSMLFLDLAVAKAEGVEQTLRPHMVLKVSQTEPTLKWKLLNYSWLEDLLKREPARLRHRFIRNEAGKEDGWVLTAETRDLRQFLQGVADDDKAWGDLQEWHRAKP